MQTRKLLILICIISLTSLRSFASHIIGGEMITTCAGDSTYTVKLILYRDCTSTTGFDDPICVGLFEDGEFNTTFNLYTPDITDIEIISPDPCLDIPPGLCVQQAIYEGTITLPSSTKSYDIIYQRCCRNAGIINIISPDGTGATYWSHIPAVATNDCNSSPYFNNYPPTALCVGSPINFDHSATDPDGDSLAYRFITPYQGGDDVFATQPCPPTGPDELLEVNWESGYDALTPIDADPLLAIDPITGLLTGTATAEGRYVVGIAVDEFRDGVLLSTHYRDFQFNIQICEPSVSAGIELGDDFVEVGTGEFLSCTDLSVHFENTSSGASSYYWDFGDPTSTTDNSTLVSPNYTYPDTGTYYVTLISNPGFDCADTAIITVNLYYSLNADFDFTAFCSGEPVEFFDQSVSEHAGDIVSWDWSFDDGDTETDQNPEHAYDEGGTYDVMLVVTTESGCTDTITIPVALLSGPDADFDVDDVCLNEAAEFDNTTTFPADVTIDNYAWEFGDGDNSSATDPDHFYPDAGTYTITLIATSTNGCSDTITQTIDIGELPNANAGIDDTVTYLDTYTLNGTGNGDFYWTPIELVSDPFSANPTIRPPLTQTYILEVTSPDGCVGYDTVTIFVKDITVAEVPNAFSPNGDGINDEIFVLSHSVGSLLEYSIYNRWGQQVFTTNSLTVGWDGTVNGKEAEVGVYGYVVRLKDFNGADVMRKGNITLVR